MNGSFHHESVLAMEVVDFLRPAPGRTFLDGTLGGGGHSALLLKAGARVIGFDREPEALTHSRKKLEPYGKQFTGVEGNYADAPTILSGLGIGQVDGVLLDLGVEGGWLHRQPADCLGLGVRHRRVPAVRVAVG